MRIGRYEVLSEVGRGGAGVVFRARTAEGGDVAIKVLHSRDATRLARFEREQRLLEELGDREGFVPLLDSGEQGGTRYLVMPFLSGGTLRERLSQGPLAPDEALRLARALARALSAAHARGIVHRDLKPENVIFTAEGAPLVADLGLAKHFETDAPASRESAVLSRSGALMGTPGYMPAEQMLDAKSAGPGADVFALGAILYECLTGVPPFGNDGGLAALDRVEKGAFTPVLELRPETPRGLARAITRCLAHEPGRRFADAGELARALAAGGGVGRAKTALAFLGVAAVVAGLASRARRRGAEPSLPAREHDAAKASIAPVSSGLVHSGTEKLLAGNFDGAIADWTEAIRRDPASLLAWINRGAVRGRRGDLDGALADLTRAVELAPLDPRALSARALVRSLRGDDPGTIEDATRALEHGARRGAATDALFARAESYTRLQRNEEAMADLVRGLELEPGNAVEWYRLAYARAAIGGDTEGEIRDCSRAIELDPKLAVAWALRGNARASLKDYEGSIGDMKQAVALEPRVASSWGNLAAAHGARGELDLAIDAADRALALDPGLATAYVNRGVAHCKKGDRALGLADFERFLELAPTSPQAEGVRVEVARLKALH
jgi:serine/threonine-protein kinase